MAAYKFNVDRFFRILTKVTEAYGAYVASKPKEVPAEVLPFPAPEAAPVVDVPKPDAQIEAYAKVRVQNLYKDILNVSRSDISNADMDSGIDLIIGGREKDLIEQLERRK